jgi:CHAT domain-containing protein/Flp pilus assembly protein TadD
LGLCGLVATVLTSRAPAQSVDDRRQDAQQNFEKGRALTLSRAYNEAIRLYEQALTTYREINDRPGEGKTLNGLGLAYTSLNQHAKALGYYDQALVVRRELHDRAGEDQTLVNLAGTCYSLGQYANEINYFEQALVVQREANNRNREAQSLNAIGYAYYRLNQHGKAVEFLNQAISIRREINDRVGERVTLYNLGQVHDSLGEYEASIASYDQALAIDRATRDRRSEAIDLGKLAWAYGLGHADFEKGIDLMEQAVVIHRELGNRSAEARALRDAGAGFAGLGRYDRAIGNYEQALAIFREIKDRPGEGSTLGWLGGSNLLLGRYERAIYYYQQALAIAREVPNSTAEATALNNIGSCYSYLGQGEKAIIYYEQALALHLQTNNVGAVVTLTNLADRYRVLQQYEKALNYNERALELVQGVRGAKDRRHEVTALTGIASTFAAMRQFDKAIAYYEKAIDLTRAIRDREHEGRTLTLLGSVYSALGKFDTAVGFHQSALALSRETRSRGDEAAALSRLMSDWSTSQPRLAVFYGKQAVNVVQEIRSDLGALDRELQESFLKSRRGTYRQLTDLLIAQGRLAEAQQVLSLLKDSEYIEFIQRGGDKIEPLKGQADLTPEEAEWERRYRDVGDQLVAIGTERAFLLNNRDLTPEETQRLNRLERDLEAGNKRFQQFLGSLARQFAAKPELNGRFEQLRDTQAFMEDLRELPAGTVAIYTLVGEEKFRAILVTPDVQKAYEYPIKASDLNRKILEFREAVQSPKLDARPAAQDLYKILLGDIADDLKQAKARTLMFSLDGTLRYLPIAALFDGEQYLIERYRVTVFTPASNARLKDQPSAEWKAVGFGVTKAHKGAAALTAVAEELNSIISERPGTGAVLLGDIRMDEAFTMESIRAELRKQFPVVHIASHFNFQSGNDLNSYLLLGDGNRLTLSELKTMASPFAGVQLLTLSACNTGIGDNTGDGTEVEGFGVLAQRKGAKSVIASLWSVADTSTSLLMREFYRIRESSPGMPKAEALRQAQLELLRGTAKALKGPASERALMHEPGSSTSAAKVQSFIASGDAPYAHPYYWAPFFLMGNWL